MIRKRKGKYVVLSHDGKRSFGEYETEAQAKKRLAQVHYFKHLHEDKGQVNCMDITKVLSYLKEELKDIPAVPKNIHYTNLESLYYILQYGLKGQLGGYSTKSFKTKSPFDMELSTVRNSHKLSSAEKRSLSSNVDRGGVKIELYTDRILASHRGSRKAPIAELPLQRKRFQKQDEEYFKRRFGFDVPKLFKNGEVYFTNDSDRLTDEDKIKDWLKENHPAELAQYKGGIVNEIYSYNRSLFNLQRELENREREERFILKRNIPVKPDLMRIEIESKPEEYNEYDEDFMEEVAANYLKLIDKHYEVFLDNRNLRLLRNYLRDLIKGQNQ